MDNKERFSDRVEQYVKYRPSYPAEAIDYLYGTVGFGSDSVIADIGAGTGKFSELLLDRGSRVLAVEPNQEMRQAAEERLGKRPNYMALSGSAEETGLSDQSVDFVVCAQSFHWFDRPRTHAEFRRILKPGGQVVLIWNSRLEHGTPFREEYERLLRDFGTDYHKVSHKNISPEALAQFINDGNMQIARFTYGQALDLEALRGRLLSSSYAPLPGHPNYEPMMEQLGKLFERTEQNGKVSFDYVTEIFYGGLVE